jgi:trimethylamine corrinoid protein
MNRKEELFEAAKRSIVNRDVETALDVFKESQAEGIDPVNILEMGYIEGIKEVGDLFGDGLLFLPELIQSSQVMEKATELINKALKVASDQTAKKKIVIATVEGDVHDIGKAIVASFFKANGFDVLDLGRDVPTEKIIEEAESFKADIIGTSALLTTTLGHQKKLDQMLQKRGLKDKMKTIIGGAPCTQRWADRIGADAYAEDAADGVKKAKLLLGI